MYVCVLLYPYIISNTSPKNMKQKLTELKGKTDTSIIIDFNISLTIINRKARQKIGEGNGTPLQYSCLENPMDGGAWWAAVHGVAKSRTRLSDFTFMHWRRKWQPTPVFLPGESQGQGSPVGCHLWGRTESDKTEATQQQQQQKKMGQLLQNTLLTRGALKQ